MSWTRTSHRVWLSGAFEVAVFIALTTISSFSLAPELGGRRLWYAPRTEAGIDEIDDGHLKGGKPVERLAILPRV